MMLSGHVGGRRLFTASQWQELEHQALIYKYMARGAPVPHDLVVPLRLATGVDTVPSLAFPPQQPPTPSLGYWGCYGAAAQLGRRAEDPEPGRCRRTDGKKWRCSREAHGDSKYCEKHIHRGKNRSRKPAEPAYRPAALSISPPAPQDATYNSHSGRHTCAPLQLHLDAAPSYHRYAYTTAAFPAGHGASRQYQVLQDAELLRRQRCLALGADLSLEKPAAADSNDKPLRRFFDEWNGGADDATQLSISMPSSSADLAAARYRNGE